MKFLFAFALIILLSFAGGLFFPWWSIAIAAFIVGVVVPIRPWAAFVCGFSALFVSWGGQAMYIDIQNNHLLASRVAAILPLGGSYMALVWITAFVGALVAGMAALTGSYFALLSKGSKQERRGEVLLSNKK